MATVYAKSSQYHQEIAFICYAWNGLYKLPYVLQYTSRILFFNIIFLDLCQKRALFAKKWCQFLTKTCTFYLVGTHSIWAAQCIKVDMVQWNFLGAWLLFFWWNSSLYLNGNWKVDAILFKLNVWFIKQRHRMKACFQVGAVIEISTWG